MYPPQAPWTGVGALQQEIEQLKSSLYGKASTYEVSTISGRLDRVENLVSDLAAEINRFLYRLQTLEASTAEKQ